MVAWTMAAWLVTGAYAAEPACGKTHPKIGHTAELERIMHRVGGTATIVDDCTMEIRNFTYDGTGIQVRIYGALGKPFRLGFPMTADLVRRRPYTGETLIARLPEGKTWDDVTNVSVWCIDFNVDFGSGVLRDPS